MGFRLNDVKNLKLSLHHKSDVTTPAIVHLLQLCPNLCRLDIDILWVIFIFMDKLLICSWIQFCCVIADSMMVFYRWRKWQLDIKVPCRDSCQNFMLHLKQIKCFMFWSLPHLEGHIPKSFSLGGYLPVFHHLKEFSLSVMNLTAERSLELCRNVCILSVSSQK